MHNRKQKTVLFALVFFTVALLGYSPLWAQDCNSATPNFTETIIDGNTKVETACDGTVTVSFWDDVNGKWFVAPPQQGVICICETPGNDCDLFDGIDDELCYTIKQGGAGTTGCLVSKNPRTYLIGGDAYTSYR